MLRLELYADDIIAIAGGIVVSIDDLDGKEVDFTVAKMDHGITHKSITKMVSEKLTIAPNIVLVVCGIRRTVNGNEMVEVGIHAPKDVMIHRMHFDDTEERLEKIINKFSTLDKNKILDVITYLEGIEY